MRLADVGLFVVLAGCAPKVVALPKPVVAGEAPLPSKKAAHITFAAGISRLFAAWPEQVGETYELRFSAFDGEKWSDAVSIAQSSVILSGGSRGPHLVARRDGSITVCWFEDDKVRIATSKDVGATWTRNFTIQGGWRDASSLAFLENANGQLVAAWIQTVTKAATEPIQMALLANEASNFRDAKAYGQQVCVDCGFSASSAADGGYLGFRHQSHQRTTHGGESTVVLIRTDRAGHGAALSEHEGWKIDGDDRRIASGPVVSTDGIHAVTAWYSAVPQGNVVVMMSTNRGRTFMGWRFPATTAE